MPETDPIAVIIAALTSSDSVRDASPLAEQQARVENDRIASISDPVERLSAASRLLESSTSAAEPARETRAAALLILSSPETGGLTKTVLAGQLGVTVNDINRMLPTGLSAVQARRALKDEAGNRLPAEAALLRAHAAVLYHEAIQSLLQPILASTAREVAFAAPDKAVGGESVKALRTLLENEDPEVSAAADQLASPTAARLQQIEDVFERLETGKDLYETAVREANAAEEVFFRAVHILIGDPAKGGEGRSRAPLARKFALDPRHMDAMLADHPAPESLARAARGLEVPGFETHTTYEVAVTARALALFSNAVRLAAGRVRAKTALEVVDGRHDDPRDPVEVMYALIADPDVRDELGIDAETAAKQLAGPRERQLEAIGHPENRLPATTQLFKDADEKVDVSRGLRNLAIKVLLTPKDKGGDGVKKAPLARWLGVTPRYFYKTLKHTPVTSMRTARNELLHPETREVMDPLAAALYGQARMLVYGAVKDAASAERIRTVKAMASGEYGGRYYLPGEIARIGHMDSPLVTYCINQAGEGARTRRIQAAGTTPLTPPIRAALLAADDDGLITNRGENAVRYNTLKGVVSRGLGDWSEAEEGFAVVLNERGTSQRNKLIEERKEAS